MARLRLIATLVLFMLLGLGPGWSQPYKTVADASSLLQALLDARKNCSTGKPCGNSCISISYTCHIGGGTPGPTTPSTYTASVTLLGTGTGSVSSSPSGIDCPSDCSLTALSGTSFTLVATPGAGSVFAGWSGSCTGTGPVTTVTVSNYLFCYATFTRTSTTTVDLILSVTGTGLGRIVSSASTVECRTGTCRISATTGTKVTLTAKPEAGSVFTGWGGACAGTGTEISITASSTANCSAAFSPGPETGWWYRASESGRGYSIEVQGQNLFLGAFAYDNNGKASWYVMTCTLSGLQCGGWLELYRGGPTLASASGTASVLGRPYAVTARFFSPDTGTLTIGSQVIPITRFPFTAGSRDVTVTSPVVGWWYDSRQLGSGWFIETQREATGLQAGKDHVFLAGYLYDTQGTAIWYVADGYMTSDRLFEGQLAEYAGGMSFDGTSSGARLVADRGKVTIRFDQNYTVGTVTLPTGRAFTIERFHF